MFWQSLRTLIRSFHIVIMWISYLQTKEISITIAIHWMRMHSLHSPTHVPCAEEKKYSILWKHNEKKINRDILINEKSMWFSLTDDGWWWVNDLLLLFSLFFFFCNFSDIQSEKERRVRKSKYIPILCGEQYVVRSFFDSIFQVITQNTGESSLEKKKKKNQCSESTIKICKNRLT